ncbi:MAG TPA: paraquat-inducible protein A [Gammaproteobacteria bacterium]|nr:paraquat-inducible protein A [Gammaproteobacteria bacterium]
MTKHCDEPLIACHDCDLLQKLPDLDIPAQAICARCGASLYRFRKNSIDRSIALGMTGLLLFFVSNLLPFLALNAQGRVQESTLLSASMILYQEGRPFLGTLVFSTTFLFPLLNLLAIMYLLIPLKFGHRPHMSSRVFRYLQSAEPWGMLEVFMLATLVAIVKLGDLATVIPGPSLYAFALLIFVLAGLSSSLDPHLIWHKLDSRCKT